MADVTLTVTGLSSTSSLGDLSYSGVSEGYGRYTWGRADWGDTNLLQEGWGRLSYGEQAWGGSPYVLLSGLSATSSVNLPTENVYVKPGWGTLDWGENGWGTVESAVQPLTALSATSSVGALSPADVMGLTGLSSTSSVGS